MLLGRDQILGADDIKHEDVVMPEWNGTVRVRAAMSWERDEYEENLYSTEVVDGESVTKTNLKNAKARLVSRCAVDMDGDPMFSPKDIEALGKKNAGAINRLFQKIATLSGMTLKAEKALEKNSGAAPTGDSLSSSPGI